MDLFCKGTNMFTISELLPYIRKKKYVNQARKTGVVIDVKEEMCLPNVNYWSFAVKCHGIEHKYDYQMMNI